MTMPEHTITVEAFGAAAGPDDLDKILSHIEQRADLLGPVVAANTHVGSVSLIATVDADRPESAAGAVSSALGAALVAAGVVESWVVAGTRAAVILATPA